MQPGSSYHPESLALLKNRRSVRAFQPRAVDPALIEEILEAARFAPSGVNTQPWHVSVLQGSILHRIGESIVGAKEAGISPNPDYRYYPETWFAPYEQRRKDCGKQLYGALSIAKEDLTAREQAWYRNYFFFQAPVGLLFWIDRRLEKGSWLDMGLFIQSVMIAARALGLETCPQASLAEYPDRIRALLGYESQTAPLSLICGMALGYADWNDPVNQYRTTRLPNTAFTRYFCDP